jgi:hypothetical protein
MLKLLEDISLKIFNLFGPDTDPILEDKIREIFAAEKCGALTSKKTVCVNLIKERGFCGIHLRKYEETLPCSHVRSDNTKCELPSIANERCWLHNDKNTKQPKRKRKVSAPQKEANLGAESAPEEEKVLKQSAPEEEKVLKQSAPEEEKVLEQTAPEEEKVLEQSAPEEQVLSLTVGYQEYDLENDDDNIIDEQNALPKFRPKHCKYIENNIMCCEPVHKHYHMCKDHVKFARKFKFNSGTCRYQDSFWFVKRPYLEGARLIAPNYHWFPHLQFYAHITENGPIVVGKAWSVFYAETLETVCLDKEPYKNDNDPLEKETGNDLIRRCHNNGLLYKVLPQEVVHKQLTLPKNIDSIEGRGFTSFEQMIRERPSLYIKYWNVWLGHIRRAKQFLTLEGKSDESLMKQFNIFEPIDWKYYKDRLGPRIGIHHVEVPAPTLEDLKAPHFDAFKYCTEWVRKNSPEHESKPHFPPMYLLYPFPTKECRQEFYEKYRTKVELIDRKQLYAHYNFRGKLRENPLTWLRWLKYGDHNGEFRLIYAFRNIEDIRPKELDTFVEQLCNSKI